MCGIHGFNFRDEQALVCMAQATSHRGPDFTGYYHDNTISLGHNLLAIRADIAQSKQPISSNPEWVLLFNGQIYNTAQIKKILPTKHETYIDSDTVLLYKMIELHGWEFIRHVHGMYAIALYNTKQKRLCLYRDPSGQKGLYYYHKDDRFIFASEIKAILSHNNIDKSLDADAIALATTVGYIPGEKTLFRYIHKLHLSQMVTLDLKTAQFSKKILHCAIRKLFPQGYRRCVHAVGCRTHPKQGGGVDQSEWRIGLFATRSRNEDVGTQYHNIHYTFRRNRRRKI